MPALIGLTSTIYLPLPAHLAFVSVPPPPSGRTMQSAALSCTTLLAFFALVLALCAPSHAAPAVEETVHTFEKRHIPPAGIATLSVGLPISVIPVGGAIIVIAYQHMKKGREHPATEDKNEEEAELQEA